MWRTKYLNSATGSPYAALYIAQLCSAASVPDPNLGSWGPRVVGKIWCVGAGEPSSRPVNDDKSGNPHKVA